MTIERPREDSPSFSDRKSVGVITLVIAVVGLAIAGVTVLFGDSLLCNGGYTGWPCKAETHDPTPPDRTPDGPSGPTAAPAVITSEPARPPKDVPVVLLSDQMTLRPPLCRTDGIDLDTARLVDSPSDAEFIFIEDACARRSDATLSALQDVPMKVLSTAPGRMPSLDECRAGLRSPDNDITGLGPTGGVLCFATTAGHVAGVVLSVNADLSLPLDIMVWDA